ncbi:3-deoxy-D-manno-octulosonic acid transferase [Psychromarinibacter sp. S121]|uniref:3-deoxy-D-manno-octulosonic acid transferase n=1 Tax=Psychromarinibacter sp. S121 TaxID=3415127 RepID=UPI003C7C0E3E
MLLYRLLLTLLSPVLLAGALLRVLRGRETWTDLSQRLGGGATTAPGAIWLHGASNGELASARTLVAALRAADPDAPLVVTANTVTGRALAEGWGVPKLTARLAPFDFRWSLARFRRRIRPSLLIVMENELWPNRIVTSPVPVACIGGRMSARSFGTWQRLPRLAALLMRRIAFLSAQDPQSARHFAELGLPAKAQGPTGTLKSGVDLPQPDSEIFAALALLFPRAETLLVASTHEGEERIVLDAFAKAHRGRPALKMILAPRHPARGDEVAALVAATGLPSARRSKEEAPDNGTAVYLADTLGEMPLWYHLAGLTFVAGSFAPKGGHTPFEPAAARSAILHGPDIANFRAAYTALDDGGGAVMVADGPALTEAVTRLAGDMAAQTTLADRADTILAAQDDSATLIATLVPRLVSFARQQP